MFKHYYIDRCFIIIINERSCKIVFYDHECYSYILNIINEYFNDIIKITVKHNYEDVNEYLYLINITIINTNNNINIKDINKSNEFNITNINKLTISVISSVKTVKIVIDHNKSLFCCNDINNFIVMEKIINTHIELYQEKHGFYFYRDIYISRLITGIEFIYEVHYLTNVKTK